MSDVTRSGFWGHPTSNCDWCEHNYERQYFVAEYWNAFAGSLMALESLYLMRIAYALRAPQIIFMIIIAMWMKGMSIFALHSTLKYQFQVLDEGPFILLNLSGLYATLIRTELFSGFHRFCLMMALISLGVAQTVLHSLFPNSWGSLASSSLTSFILICSFSCLIFQTAARHQDLAILKSQFFACQFILLLAFVCWVGDRFYCKQITQFLNMTPQLYALYLILLGYYIYSAVFLLLNCTFVQKYNLNIILFDRPLKWIPMASREQLEKAKMRILNILQQKDNPRLDKAMIEEKPLERGEGFHYHWTIDPWSKLIDYETAFSNYPKMYKFLTALQICVAILFTVFLFV